MRRLILRGSLLNIALIVICVFALSLIQAPRAFAQRGGGHAGAPMSAPRAPMAPRAPAPPRPAPVAPRPVMPRNPGLARPLANGLVAPGFRPPHPRPPGPRPIRPIRPIAPNPIFIYPPYFGFGLGFGFNPLWSENCSPFWDWNFGCGAVPYGGYDFDNNIYAPGPVSPYEYPDEYPEADLWYGTEPRELVELYLKDGTVYDVTDYWLVNDELHFTTTENGKSVEHTIPFDELDLQKTVDVNTQLGFRFVLRNEPIEQYLQDHPDDGSSANPAPDEGATPAPPETQPPQQ
ncbi:MAG TPA: hypothetical protein VMB47_07350 [Candidatus Aquilonibacter sp.]|nr:hypothetical protein [Candidatus Aquilonibacter sp.]